MKTEMLSLARVRLKPVLGLTGANRWADIRNHAKGMAEAGNTGAGYPGCQAHKGSRGKMLVYLALHYFDLDAEGSSQTGSIGEIARVTGLAWAGRFGKDGSFPFQVMGYGSTGQTGPKGRRGYLNLGLGELKALASIQDTNIVRLALWFLAGLDATENNGIVQLPMEALQNALPRRMTQAAIVRTAFAVWEAFPDLVVKLSEDAVSALWEHTEGCAAAIRKAAHRRD